MLKSGEFMKKNIILLALLISACSQSNNNSAPPATPEENVYNLDALGIGFFSGSPQAEPANNLTDLGDVVQGQKKTLVVAIKNMGTTATPIFSPALNNSNFYITSSTCSSKSLPPNGGSCSLTINFSSTGKALGAFTGRLSFGSSFTDLKAAVITSAQAGGGTGGGGGGGGGGSTAPLIKFYDGTTQVVEVSPSSYNIGQVAGTAKTSKIITIKNEGTAPTLVSDASLSSSSFYLTSNSCTGKQLLTTAPNNTCSVTVNFSGSAKIAGQTYTSNLSFSATTVAVSASVTLPPPPPTPPPAMVVFKEGSATLSAPLFLGTYSNDVTLSKTISIQNIGGSATAPISLELLNNSAGWFVVSNSCSNVILQPSGSCSFSLRVSTSNKPTADYLINLKFSTTTQDVYFSRIAPLTCPSGEHTEGGVCVANTRSCDPMPSNSASGVQNWTGSSWGSCQIAQCSSGHFLNNNSCQPDVITYSPVYSNYGACSVDEACEGQGSSLRTVVNCNKLKNGQPDGSAPAAACSAQAQDLSISCDSPEGQATVSMPHGSKTISCLAGQTTGTFVSGVCTDAGYNLVGEACEINKVTVSVSKSKNYGDVTSQPLGINCANVSSCQFDFDYGTVVTLYPTVSSGNGYEFGGWSGACSGTGSCSFTADANKSVEMIVGCAAGFHEESGSCFENQRSCVTMPENAQVAVENWTGSNWGSCQISTCAGTTILVSNNCVNSLVLNPSSPNALNSAGVIVFSASGGKAPFVYSISSSGGIGSSIGSSNGVYVAGTNNTGQDLVETVRVTDSLGLTAEASFTVIADVVTPGAEVIAPAFKLSAVPSTLDFLRRNTGSSSITKPLLFRNVGVVSLDKSLQFSSLPAVFSIENNDCSSGSLSPGEFCQVDFSFNPETAGNHGVDLNTTYSSLDLSKTGNLKTNIKGFAGIPIDIKLSSETLDFGLVSAGSVNVIKLNVTNLGTEVVTNVVPVITGSQAFSLQGEGFCPQLLAPEGSCDIYVRYNSEDQNIESATLSIEFTSTSSTVVKNINLAGTSNPLLVSNSSPITATSLSSISGSTIGDIIPLNENEFLVASYDSSNIYIQRKNIVTQQDTWVKQLTYSGAVYRLKLSAENRPTTGTAANVHIAVEFSGTINFAAPLIQNYTSYGGNLNSYSGFSSHGERSVGVIYFKNFNDAAPSNYLEVFVNGSNPARYTKLGFMPPLIDGNTGFVSNVGSIFVGGHAYSGEVGTNLTVESYSSLAPYNTCSSTYSKSNGTTLLGAYTTKKAGFLVEFLPNYMCNYLTPIYSSAGHDVELLAINNIAASGTFFYSRLFASVNNTMMVSLKSGFQFQSFSASPALAQEVKALGVLFPDQIAQSFIDSNGTKSVHKDIDRSYNTFGSTNQLNYQKIQPQVAINGAAITSPYGAYGYIVSKLQGPGVANIDGKPLNVQGSDDILITQVGPNNPVVYPGHFLLSGANEQYIGSVSLGQNLGVIVNCPSSENLKFLGNTVACSGLTLMRISTSGPKIYPQVSINTPWNQLYGMVNQAKTLYFSLVKSSSSINYLIDSVSLMRGEDKSLNLTNCSQGSNLSSCSIGVVFNPTVGKRYNDRIIVNYSEAGTGAKFSVSAEFGFDSLPNADCPVGSTQEISTITGSAKLTCQCSGGKVYDVVHNTCVNNDLDTACFSKGESDCQLDSKCNLIPEATIKCQPKKDMCLVGVGPQNNSSCTLISLDGVVYGQGSSRLNCGKGAKVKTSGPLYGDVCECVDPTQEYDTATKSCIRGSLDASVCSGMTAKNSCTLSNACQWIPNSQDYFSNQDINGSCVARCENLGESSCSSNGSCSWNSGENRCEISRTICQAQSNSGLCHAYNRADAFYGSPQSCIWDTGSNSCDKYCYNGIGSDGLCLDEDLSQSCSGGMVFNYLLNTCVEDCSLNSEFMYFENGSCGCKDWTSVFERDNMGMNSQNNYCRTPYNTNNVQMENGRYPQYPTMCNSYYYNGYTSSNTFDPNIVRIDGYNLIIGECRAECGSGASYSYANNQCECYDGNQMYIGIDYPNLGDFNGMTGCYDRYGSCSSASTTGQCSLLSNCSWNSMFNSCQAQTCSSLAESSCVAESSCSWDTTNQSCGRNCQANTDQTSCTNVGGDCEWDYAGNQCYQLGGTPACEDRDEMSCSAAGCSWYGFSCHSNSPNCGDLIDSMDCSNYGCYWHPDNSCQSEQFSCSNIYDSSECMNLGCSWMDDGMGGGYCQ